MLFYVFWMAPLWWLQQGRAVRGVLRSLPIMVPAITGISSVCCCPFDHLWGGVPFLSLMGFLMVRISSNDRGCLWHGLVLFIPVWGHWVVGWLADWCLSSLFCLSNTLNMRPHYTYPVCVHVVSAILICIRASAVVEHPFSGKWKVHITGFSSQMSGPKLISH